MAKRKHNKEKPFVITGEFHFIRPSKKGTTFRYTTSNPGGMIGTIYIPSDVPLPDEIHLVREPGHEEKFGLGD